MKAGLKKKITAMVAAAGAAAALVVGSAGNSAATAPRLEAIALLNDGGLMASFFTDRPDVLNWVRRPVGLVGDVRLVGLDFRVQDGQLYGVGEKGGIYRIKLPELPSNPDPIVTKVSQLGVTLSGTFFGVDFNPAADRLRVISDDGQNLRHNLNDHTTIVDGGLNINASSAKGVTAAAYTNNDLNVATATTLFDISTVTDQVLIQSPPNNGSLVATGALTVDAGINAGFDIFADLVNHKTVDNHGFAVLTTPDGLSKFYSVNVLTGTATPIGDPFPLPVTEVAIPLDPQP
ncbi:DUF4394 domain-containing protein [Actinophytocola sp.]|uniref:DUF4394 domain-containing protein n=1 Tax=Actinophytocola sp. TaxID=1872138 RepID=UPI002ED0BABE